MECEEKKVNIYIRHSQKNFMHYVDSFFRDVFRTYLTGSYPTAHPRWGFFCENSIFETFNVQKKSSTRESDMDWLTNR